ncbi:hypothetical protein B9Z55_023944 [Caenorhabditis nigoni]|uniref:Uncharacterized protein n=1 Tax=Caenorhabditis nigoni TaxID=1611254 RepID=A0A2G5SRU7_9PELO|nr:hypothetical protein B9Z55_023944 [Caenorhabditis nigoni]
MSSTVPKADFLEKFVTNSCEMRFRQPMDLQNLIDYLNVRIGCDEEINQKSIVRLACEVLSINFQIRCPWHTGFANYLRVTAIIRDAALIALVY